MSVRSRKRKFPSVNFSHTCCWTLTYATALRMWPRYEQGEPLCQMFRSKVVRQLSYKHTADHPHMSQHWRPILSAFKPCCISLNKVKLKLELKMFYQTHTARMAAEITPGSDGMVPSATALRHLQPARSMPSLPRGDALEWKARFVPDDLDLWPWHSNSSERDQTRLPCEFGAICSTVP